MPRASARTAAALAGLLVLASSPGAWADEPLAPRAPPAEPGPGMASPGLVAGGTVLGVLGLGSTGVGVFLTLKGSTLDCFDCAESSDDAPLIAGGLTAIVLGLGMAATGGTMIVLGLRDEPTGVRVRTEVRAGPGGVSVVGAF